MRPLILNIETATEVCSIAVSRGEDVLALEESSEQNDHAKVITLLIERCLASSNVALIDLDAVAVSAGPGSYTSLRVGSLTAKGICYALDKPLIGVDTLQALALATQQQERKEALYCPMIDARRMEVYCELFDAENRSVTKPLAKVINETSFQEYFFDGRTIVFSGNGAGKCRQVLKSNFAHFSSVVCSAVHLAPLSSRAFVEGRLANVAYFVPFYQKAPNITTPKKEPLF